MKKMKFRMMLLMLAVALALIGCTASLGIREVPTKDSYSFTNPEVVKAETDAGIVIDGVLDEEAYKSNNWLYLYNKAAGNDVSIAMTSHYGEKGMYLVFDVTESVPIYVNQERNSYMNSCIELYLGMPNVLSMQDNGVFEIDLMPDGEMLFKRGNGKFANNSVGFGNVASSNDIMARFGATTKGGPVNTESCYGYCMELFIPWAYMEWLDVDTDAVKNGFVYVNPAHITSFNYTGTNTNLDRHWYHYIQQKNGTKFSNVTQYFRFNGEGVMNGIPVDWEQGEHYTVSGATNVYPGMNAFVTVKPDAGYVLTSVLVNGEDKFKDATLNEDGSVTLKIPGTGNSVNISAKAEAIPEGRKNISGKIVLKNSYQDTLEGIMLTCIGPNGEQPLTVDTEGKFALKDLEPGYYVLQAEKSGYNSVSHSMYLASDVEIEMVLFYDYLQVVAGDWNLDDQFDGRITILNKIKDGSSVMTSANTYKEASVTVKDYTPSKNADGSLKKGNFSMQIGFVFDNGKRYEVRIHNTDNDGNYKIQTMGGTDFLPDGKWKWQKDLTDAQKEALLNGDGVKFTVKLEGAAAVMYVNGTEMARVDLGADYEGKTAQVRLTMNGNNNGQNIQIPFELK